MMVAVKGVLSSRRAPILAALANGKLDTFEIAAATGIDKPGSILHTLMVERKVRRAGTRDTGRRPLVVWELT
jgi:hypothetical protein